MKSDRIDPLVLTVRHLQTPVDFYQSVMGMRKVVFGGGRIALDFGQKKVNLHAPVR